MLHKKDETTMTPEELERRNLIRRRCLWVLIILDLLVLVYLVAQLIMVFTNQK